ncbi:hypothetical protein [Bacillus gaemokensis]|uniref:Uncharacterized protein n=1 Tax=Bacillus gaemokensis TaxID=574375 RepID=A0A073KDX0_9BACI|nr:hypothetical protein [Bacillus gaemokensis]KEK24726.1 hypothetical protein BAGA_24005 [Bacillus gaemokensis]KYG34549.1 hypothetical protein AZF08_09125 [Bacillus gaemokensis]
MTILDYYTEAKRDGIVSAWLLIEYLVFERKVLTFLEDVSKLDYYYQSRFRKRMNQYLIQYMIQRGMDVSNL